MAVYIRKYGRAAMEALSGWELLEAGGRSALGERGDDTLGAHLCKRPRPHRQQHQVPGVGRDLEPRVRDALLPPPRVRRTRDRVARAVEEKRLRLDLLGLEPPRLQAVAGDVGGQAGG